MLTALWNASTKALAIPPCVGRCVASRDPGERCIFMWLSRSQVCRMSEWLHSYELRFASVLLVFRLESYSRAYFNLTRLIKVYVFINSELSWSLHYHYHCGVKPSNNHIYPFFFKWNTFQISERPGGNKTGNPYCVLVLILWLASEWNDLMYPISFPLSFHCFHLGLAVCSVLRSVNPISGNPTSICFPQFPLSPLPRHHTDLEGKLTKKGPFRHEMTPL